uniref:Uncharacterized protein n=1 Tax=Leersia perrieri TaxID=77586 RepID=A0A0D9XUV5_9ORYZ
MAERIAQASRKYKAGVGRRGCQAGKPKNANRFIGTYHTYQVTSDYTYLHPLAIIKEQKVQKDFIGLVSNINISIFLDCWCLVYLPIAQFAPLGPTKKKVSK